jgi:hypothetical protein
MQRVFTVFLSCVLSLMSSGFATSRNRFETRTILTPRAHARPAQATLPICGGRQHAKSLTGQHQGSTNAHQKNGLYQNLQRRSSNARR